MNTLIHIKEKTIYMSITKNKLWGFGDSFSIPFKNYEDSPHSWLYQYRKWKGYTPKISAEIIAEQLGFDYIYGSEEQPFDNDSIFESIIKNLDNFQDGDFLFIGIAPIHRFRFVDTEHDVWQIYNLHNDPEFDSMNKCYEKFSLQKLHPLHLQWVEYQCNLIKKACSNCEIFFWHWASEGDHEYETIKEETNDIIDDLHWSEKGHYDFAQDFLEKYKQNKLDNLFSEEKRKHLLY